MRSIPYDCLCSSDSISVDLFGLFTSVQTEPSLGDLSLEIVWLSRALLGQSCSADEIDGEVDLDTLLFCFGEDFIDDLVASFIEKGFSNIDVMHLLQESESHASSDDHFVNFGEHVPDQLDLVGNLGSSENDEEGSLGAL